MIGVDWGTSSFRAFRLTREGAIRDRKTGPRGILAVADGRFADTLREEIGPWLAAGERHVLLSGMVGSRQGWVEAPYLPCPAGPDEIAAALVDVPVRLGPGEDRAGAVGRGYGWCSGTDARRGNPACRGAGHDGRHWLGLPAGHSL